MKSFKPKDHDFIGGYLPENANDLFIDIKIFELYRKVVKDNMMYKLGKTVFVFDIDSCEFFEEENNNG